MSALLHKQKALRKHKAIATGLFFAMAILYIICVVSYKHYPSLSWILYVKAFSEAAMVGALADWFAVTALFNHPLGLKIPHTNIIQKSQQSIGDNLGNFIVENFLNAQNIKPYISQIDVVQPLLEWLSSDTNKHYLAKEITKIGIELFEKIDDEDVTKIIAQQGQHIIKEIDLQSAAHSLLTYLADSKEIDQAVNSVGLKIIEFILSHKTFIEGKVKDNSYFFVPNFINNKLADKIEEGLIKFVTEIIEEEQHPTRLEIKAKIRGLAEDIRSKEEWQEKLEKLRDQLIAEDKMLHYAQKIWLNIKLNIQDIILNKHDIIVIKIENYLGDFSESLAQNQDRKTQINTWVQTKAYYYALKNSSKIADLVSNTVKNWDGKALSEKLELEVGKDLQYIRINGTIVGGLVGLIIYGVTNIFL